MPQDHETERRIHHLLATMTLEEKVGQLNQEHDFHRIDPDDVRAGHIGSLLCANSAYAGNDRQERVLASELNRLQRIAVEESRLGIPIIVGRDVIHGHRTVCPIPLGQAASWSPEVVEKCAEIAAREARADGVHWTFAPMLDIARDPRWGRVAEGFGEDTYLCSELARAAVRGFQGDDMTNPERLVACAKHYLGYGAAEGGRDYNTAEISPSTIRNVYAPPFKAAVEAGIGTLMAAFNEIGGVPVSASRKLLTDILRTEWGFDGFVVSDWGAVGELIEHGIATNRREAARLALTAGVDMDMVYQVYRENLVDLVHSGVLPESAVDEAVRRVLRVKFRMGLFEHPYTDEGLAEEVHLRDDHRQTALEAARKSLVLLKNDGVLPLTPGGGRLAVVGPLADATEALFGTWTLDGAGVEVTSIRNAISARSGKVVNARLADEAIAAARHCEAVVAIVGEAPSRSGEDSSVTSLDLPPGQTEMIERLHSMGKPLVVVAIAGRPLSIGSVLECADAVLWAFHPGGEGGTAIAEALFGETNPAGKLPVSFPRSVGQVPIYYNHKPTGRPLPKNGAYSRYVDGPDRPLLPFGYGLSYTTFSYGDLSVTATAKVGETIRVRATVTNTGDRAGEEVVQLYVRDRVGSITRPVKELKGFARIALEPGESRVVSFDLGPDDLGFFDNEGRYLVEPGRFDVWIAPSSDDGLHGEFELSTEN